MIGKATSNTSFRSTCHDPVTSYEWLGRQLMRHQAEKLCPANAGVAVRETALPPPLSLTVQENKTREGAVPKEERKKVFLNRENKCMGGKINEK